MSKLTACFAGSQNLSRLFRNCAKRPERKHGIHKILSLGIEASILSRTGFSQFSTRSTRSGHAGVLLTSEEAPVRVVQERCRARLLLLDLIHSSETKIHREGQAVQETTSKGAGFYETYIPQRQVGASGISREQLVRLKRRTNS